MMMIFLPIKFYIDRPFSQLLTNDFVILPHLGSILYRQIHGIACGIDIAVCFFLLSFAAGKMFIIRSDADERHAFD